MALTLAVPSGPVRSFPTPRVRDPLHPPSMPAHARALGRRDTNRQRVGLTRIQMKDFQLRGARSAAWYCHAAPPQRLARLGLSSCSLRGASGSESYATEERARARSRPSPGARRGGRHAILRLICLEMRKPCHFALPCRRERLEEARRSIVLLVDLFLRQHLGEVVCRRLRGVSPSLRPERTTAAVRAFALAPTPCAPRGLLQPGALDGHNGVSGSSLKARASSARLPDRSRARMPPPAPA